MFLVRKCELRGTSGSMTLSGVEEPLLNHTDVTTIMDYLGRVADDVAEIRRLLEDDDDEEEEPEADG